MILNIFEYSLFPIYFAGTKNVVRFDSGVISGKSPHIDLDFRGYPNRKYGPVEVPSSVVEGAGYLQAVMQYLGPLLTASTYVVEAYRLVQATREDLAEQAEKNQLDGEKRDKIRHMLRHEPYALEYYEPILEQSFQPNAFMPNHLVRTSSSITGSWLGGSVGAYTGVTVGTAVGACALSLLGPTGVLVGSIGGAVLGGIGGGTAGASYGASGGEVVADNLVEAGWVQSLSGYIPNTIPNLGLSSLYEKLPEASNLKEKMPGLETISKNLPAMPPVPDLGLGSLYEKIPEMPNLLQKKSST